MFFEKCFGIFILNYVDISFYQFQNILIKDILKYLFENIDICLQKRIRFCI